MIKIDQKFILIETKNTSLAFEIKDYNDERTPFNKGKKYVTQYYYGFKNELKNLTPTAGVLPANGSTNDYNGDKLISSTFGNGNNKECLLLIENSDNTLVNRFFYSSCRVFDGPKDIEGPKTRNVKETLEIIEVDEIANLELHHYYSIVEDSDVIVSKKEIINKSEKPCNILRAFSLELPISSVSLDVETFDGSWLYERTRHVTSIGDGLFSIDSKLGGSSSRHNPYIQVLDKDNNYVYAFNLIYSGNHKEQVEVNNLQYASIMVGINDFGFNYLLKPNESFITPEAIFALTKSKDEMTKTMHNFVKNHIINPLFINKPRPVLFNNWEGTGMNIDEQSLLDMAVIAKKVGVELFVVDDGWFKGRVTDSFALGDWVVDNNKFPNGLKPFVNKIKSMGLKFGIWIEPEMISIESDLYKSHPEFAMQIPNREPIERRHQLMLDMSNKDVVDYIFNLLIKVFDEIKPDYIKWDYNRFMSDMYSSKIRCGEYQYRYIFGTYDLFNRLTSRYPETLFEGCSSGGGRFDLGMLYYTPQIWGSDDTNTYCRAFITNGTLTMYPQSTIGAHVSRDYCPKSGRDARSSLEDRFNLNCIGAFGYEFDFRTFKEDELEVMTKQIEFYKLHRELLQNGTFYVIQNVFDDNRYFSYNVVSETKDEAILMAMQLEKDDEEISWKMKGLDSDSDYEVIERKQYNVKEPMKFVLSGQTLMEDGFKIPSLNKTSDALEYSLGVFSRLFYIKKIK